YITRIEQFISECNESSDDQIEIKEIAQAYSKIQEYESQFITIHRNLSKDMSEKDMLSEKSEHEGIMKRIHSAKADLLKIYTDVCPLHGAPSDITLALNDKVEDLPMPTPHPSGSILKQSKLTGTTLRNTDNQILGNVQGAYGGNIFSENRSFTQDQAPSSQYPGSNTSSLEAALSMLINHQMRAEDRNQELFRQLGTAISAIPTATTQQEPHSNKLPTLDVPKFSGDRTQWSHFKGMFRSIVHDNRRLSRIQKLQYLMSYLTGNALKLVENTPLSDHGYESAWRLLQKHFDDGFTVVHCEIERFCKIPAITTPNVPSFTTLYATTVSVLDSLDGQNATSRDPWVIYLLLSKLDSETKALWSREVSALTPTLDKFLDFLSARLKSLEMCQTTPSSDYDKTTTKIASSKPVRPRLSLAAVTGESSPTPCFACQETDHRLFRCPKFLGMSPSDRLNISFPVNEGAQLVHMFESLGAV
uniref:Uncharacterized protein n=1 Tax=Phlebotomus papatasi TaxID=29031 RepID=A0A1B0DHK0_PHLPP